MKARVVLALTAAAAVGGAVVLAVAAPSPSRPASLVVAETAVPTITPTSTPTAAPTAAPSTAPTAAPTAIPVVPPTFGGDVSWPNCPLGTPGHLPKRPPKGLGMPGPDAQFVVIGLTNGPGFYPNPCLAAQVSEARSRHLLTAAYAFTTMPNADQLLRYGGSGPLLSRMRRAATAEAQVNIASIRRTGLRTPIIWMDVEPQDYLSPWGTNVTVNRAVIAAAQDAYHRAGFGTGYYSAPFAWQPITGGLRDGSPTWVTSGPRSRAAAEAKCRAPSFSGGPVALSQWWVPDVADYDVTCATAKADLRRYFSPS